MRASDRANAADFCNVGVCGGLHVEWVACALADMGGAAMYRQHCEGCACAGHEGFELTRRAQSA